MGADDRRPRPIVFPDSKVVKNPAQEMRDQMNGKFTSNSQPERTPGKMKFKDLPPATPPPEPQRQPGKMKFKDVRPPPISQYPRYSTTSTNQDPIEVHFGQPIVTPEEAQVLRMAARAELVDPTLARSGEFRSKLTLLQQSKISALINWGAEGLERNRVATNALAGVTRELTFLEANRWIDEAKTESCKPPGFLRRSKAGYYESKLVQIRLMLNPLVTTVSDWIAALKPGTLAQDTLALQVFAETLTQPQDIALVDNRVRTLISAEQMIRQTQIAFANLQASLVQTIQQIDQLLNTVIPQWKLSEASR